MVGGESGVSVMMALFALFYIVLACCIALFLPEAEQTSRLLYLLVIIEAIKLVSDK